VHHADHLLGRDAVEVGARRRQIGVPQLALDQRQRDPFVQQLDRVGMPKLMGRKAPPNPSLGGEVAQLCPDSAV